MNTCPNCNTVLQENDRFCPNCGVAINAAPQPQTQPQPQPQAQPQPQQSVPNYTAPPVQQPFAAAPYPAPNFRKVNGGMLAWSIINIVLGVLFGIPTLVLGIVATTKTNAAAKAMTDYEEQAMLKTAKTLNLVASILAGVMLMLTIVVLIVGSVAGVALGEFLQEAASSGISY